MWWKVYEQLLHKLCIETFILSAALPKIKNELSVLTKEKLVNWLFEGWNDKYY